MRQSSAHLFAIFLRNGVYALQSGLLTSSNRELCHRIRKVLRLRVDDQCIFFDSSYVFYVRLKTVEEAELEAIVEKKEACIRLAPTIDFWLPLVEKSQMELLFYAVAQHQVRYIQIVKWQKSTASWGSEHDFERAERIMIAACEQSKNFIVPSVSRKILSMQDLNPKNLILCEQWGGHVLDVLPQLKLNSEITLCVGPEGGCTDQETEWLRQHAKHTIRLTPAVLRSCDAGTLALGLVRSLVH